MKRLAIAFFYDKDGVVDDYMLLLVAELGKFVDKTVFISNGFLTQESKARLKGVVQDILVRENEGFDVWAYKVALEYVGYETLASYDEIILYNHTVYGPLFPFSEIFSEMGKRTCSFWGITSHKRMEPNPFTGNGILPFHLNSHFIAVRRDMASSDAFRHYWENMPKIGSYRDSILLHEARFVEHFTNLGYAVSVYMDSDQFSSNYPLFEEVDEAIRIRCPILKRRSLFADPVAMDQMAIDLPRALTLITETSNYDIDLIWRNILRQTELRVLHTNAVLFKIFPDSRLQTKRRKYGRIAVCVHIYYIGMLHELFLVCNNIPVPFDFIATTDTDEKKSLIELFISKARNRYKLSLFGARSKINNVVVRVVEKNIGCDTSALLITCRDIIISGNYELVCRLHSKKSIQDTGGRGRYFKHHLFENLANSPGYVANVLDMFFDNPRIGLAIAPAIHVHYSTLGHGWFTNRARTESIAARIGINVSFDSDTPVAPYGGMFWFRPSALRKLFAYPWAWNDFESELSYGDGDLPHSVERIYAYVAQDAGFLTQTIACLHQAEQSYVRLEYKVQKLASLIPAGDFAYKCHVLSKWKEAGHPLEPERPDDSNKASQTIAQLISIAFSRLQRRLKWRRGIIAHVDLINQIALKNARNVSLYRNDCTSIKIVGWAIPTASDEAFDAIAIHLTGDKACVSASAKLLSRSDVADHYGQKNFEKSGMEWECAIELLKAGTYSARVVGSDKSGTDYSTDVGNIFIK